MFEDALVESSGRLKSKSKYWMFATFAFNLAVLTAMVLVPLLYPEALPKTAMIAMLTAPPPPAPAPKPPAPAEVKPVRAVAPLDPMVAPAKVPNRIDRSKEPPPPLASTGVVGVTMGAGGSAADSITGALATGPLPIVVAKQDKPKQTGPLKISSGVAAGAVLSRTTPVYPAIAKAAHVSGAVVLHAIISKTGTIESLQVLSGPEMLRASALDAVRQWRYRPYLLNGEPTEVDTAIKVNFSFSG